MPVMAPPLKATSSAGPMPPCGGLGGAHVGAHRDVHADEAAGAGEDRADDEADGGLPSRARADQDRAAPRRRWRWWCTAGQVGGRAGLDGRRDFLHAALRCFLVAPAEGDDWPTRGNIRQSLLHRISRVRERKACECKIRLPPMGFPLQLHRTQPCPSTNVTPGKHVPDAFNVIIEIPMNADPVKYEVDKETGAIFVDRFMSTAMHYPTNYGYVPKTISGDGDPVDVLVITPVPLIPGVVVTCRPLGILKMEDEAGEDAKVLAVPIDKILSIYTQWQKPEDLNPLRLKTIAHFFEHYKDLEPGKWVKVLGWEGPSRPSRKSWTASPTTRRNIRGLIPAARSEERRIRGAFSLAEGRARLQVLQVVLDAAVLARQELRPPRRRRPGGPASARWWSSPASGRAPSCARPGRRPRSAAGRWRCTRRAAGSSRPRSAGSPRAPARPSSARRRPRRRRRSGSRQWACRGARPRTAASSPASPRHAAEEVAREVGRVAVLEVGALVAAVEEVPVRRADLRPRAWRKVTPASATLRRSWRIFLRLSCVRRGQEGVEVGVAGVSSSGTAPCGAA